VALTVIVTILLGDKLDKFLSILGAVSCTPIAFIFPALFHLKASAKTPAQKYTDIAIIILAIGIMIYCTTLGVIGWNKGDEELMHLYPHRFDPSNPPK